MENLSYEEFVRALEADPAHRYQSMAQFEYDLVKSLFGRSRAVTNRHVSLTRP